MKRSSGGRSGAAWLDRIKCSPGCIGMDSSRGFGGGSMLMLKLSIAVWMLFTAVWMFTQDIRIERLEKKQMEGGVEDEHNSRDEA